MDWKPLVLKDLIIYVYVHEYMNVQETSVRLPGTVVTGHCELLHWVLGIKHRLIASTLSNRVKAPTFAILSFFFPQFSFKWEKSSIKLIPSHIHVNQV